MTEMQFSVMGRYTVYFFLYLSGYLCCFQLFCLEKFSCLDFINFFAKNLAEMQKSQFQLVGLSVMSFLIELQFCRFLQIFLMDSEKVKWVKRQSSIACELQQNGNQTTISYDLFNLLSQYEDLISELQKHFIWLSLLEACLGSGVLMQALLEHYQTLQIADLVTSEMQSTSRLGSCLQQ